MQENDSIGGASKSELDNAAVTGTVTLRMESDPLWDPSWIESMADWESKVGDGHIILVFCDAPSILGRECGGTRFFDLRHEVCPAPGIYLVGQSTSSTAWLVPGSGTDFQGDCSTAEAMGIDRPTAMVLGRKAGHCLLWIGGIADPQIAMELPLSSGEELTEAKILDELALFEQHCWGHQFRKKIWKEKAPWVPKESAEAIVQDELHTWLSASFRHFNTFPEVNLDIGRADLLMMSKRNRPEKAVLELKVAKAITSGGEPISPAKEQARILQGRVQTKAYALKVCASIRLLCAYDLRQENSQSFFEPIVSACKAEQTTFKTYRIVYGAPEGQSMLVGTA